MYVTILFTVCTLYGHRLQKILKEKKDSCTEEQKWKGKDSWKFQIKNVHNCLTCTQLDAFLICLCFSMSQDVVVKLVPNLKY